MDKKLVTTGKNRKRESQNGVTFCLFSAHSSFQAYVELLKVQEIVMTFTLQKFSIIIDLL